SRRRPGDAPESPAVLRVSRRRLSAGTPATVGAIPATMSASAGTEHHGGEPDAGPRACREATVRVVPVTVPPTDGPRGDGLRPRPKRQRASSRNPYRSPGPVRPGRADPWGGGQPCAAAAGADLSG